ncbi:MAG: hypothetical protein MUP58_03585, partial [Candidatus Nanohaloarchaeota archaeon QJJ-9]|nr:hypothetical protein [Candidatus Nanohaloarchaeota archaeon QJJ-9]
YLLDVESSDILFLLNNVFDGNNGTASYGVDVRGAEKLMMKDSIIKETTLGLRLKSIHAHVSETTVKDQVQGGGEEGHGIHVADADVTGSFSKMSVTGNEGRGFDLQGGPFTIKESNIENNKIGVNVFGGTSADDGIPGEHDVVIEDSNITGNNDYGVYLDSWWNDNPNHGGEAPDVKATFNYWGNETGPSRLVNGEWIGDGDNITGKVEFIPWYPTMEAKEAVNKVSDSSMKAPAGDSNISVGGNNVSIDFSESAKTKTENGEEVTEVNTTGNLKVTGLGNESMEIPGNTTIKGENWDGKIKAPETKSEPTVNPDPSPGFTVQTGKTIQVGSEKTSLEFSNAVRLVIPDEAGKKAGYIRPGDEEVTKIGMTCDENSQTWADSNLNLSTSEGECYTDAENGEDLVIWTKHFTEFLVYEETQVQEDTETDSGGSITVCEEGDWNCTEWSECTDGIETRECEKTVSCGDFYDRAPAETQSCPMEVAQECPTCPAPSEWSECTDGTESRTNYRCGEGTDFECTEYTEQRQCEEVEAEVLEGSVGETEGPTGFLVQERTGFIAGIISLVVIAGTLMYWRMTE